MIEDLRYAPALEVAGELGLGDFDDLVELSADAGVEIAEIEDSKGVPRKAVHRDDIPTLVEVQRMRTAPPPMQPIEEDEANRTGLQGGVVESATWR
jgi:hypothetical protein